MKKGILLLMLVLSTCAFLRAQKQDSKVDSLLQLYDQSKEDTIRIQLLLDIGDVYTDQTPDTALYYYKKALNIAGTNQPINQAGLNSYKKTILSLEAKTLCYIGYLEKDQGNYIIAKENYSKAIKKYNKIGDKKRMAHCYNKIGLMNHYQGNYNSSYEYYLKALKISEELEDKENISICYNHIGILHIYQGNYNDAIEYLSRSLQISEELGDKVGMAKCYGNIGIIHTYKGNYDNAVEYYLKSLKIKEELGDKKGMSNSYSNIGSIHTNQGNYDIGIEYYLKALKIDEELNDKLGMAACYNNIGSIHNNQDNYNSAMWFYLKALKISEEYGDKRGMATCFGNIGLIQKKLNSYDKAIGYYLKALKTNKELNDKDAIASNYSRLASLHMSISDTCKNHNGALWKTNLESTLKYARKSYDLSKKISALPRQKKAASNLQEAYTKLGNYKEALKYAEIYIATQDSMFSQEKTKAIAEMTTKYEAEKKRLQIEKMEQQKLLDDKTIEAQQAQNRKQLIIIFSAIGAFVTVLFFSIVILRMLGQKRKANIILANQNIEINQQKEKIEEQHRNITDSIVYAQRIQHALLPPGDYMKQLLPHRFILYKPRDIVSGDFYWVNKKDGQIITTAADSTGHGVPGAMLSMLGVSILNEVVGSMQKPNAGEILNNFRSKLIDSLHQGGEETNMWDGFDIALCLIDLKKKNVQYAGANCPLYLIREGELIETKGDKMPIGIHARMEPFTNHNIKIQSGDSLYIFSDGYIDQFGGEDDKRFTQRRFKKLLLDIHNKSMPEQKEELEKNLTAWQGNTNQIDDILVMGVRI